MREVNVRVVDRGTYRGNRTSRMIEHKEYARIYPDTRTQRLNFIFKFREEKLVPERQAKFLERKYPGLCEIVGTETITLSADEQTLYNVEKLKRPGLLNLAARMDIPKALTMKNEVLRESIKKAIVDGVVPISQEEYEIRKKERA